MRNYKYYNKEKASPFEGGREVWWRLERYAYEAQDDKDVEDDLSLTMCAYIRERVWECVEHDTSWTECLSRACELYKKGLWSAAYLCDKAATLQSAY